MNYGLLDSVERIHDITACYTANEEVEALLDALNWPHRDGLLLDPGCGSGNMIVAALARLEAVTGDIDALCSRLRGIEFHSGAVIEARERVTSKLVSKGWSGNDATAAADRIILHSDFLLDDPVDQAGIILANPPYMRRHRLPEDYRKAFDLATWRHARGDVLHAYLLKMIEALRPGGRIGLISSDRWLMNSGTSQVRKEVGKRLGVHELRRLDSSSAFHRPKTREKDTPPRVHAVSMILAEGGNKLTSDPYRIDPVPEVEGILLGDLVDLRLAPYLGPDGIFMVEEGSGLPPEVLVPCIEPKDICPRTGHIGAIRRWAIVTGDEQPHPAVMRHLNEKMDRMPASARRKVPWHPPERFDRHLPLDRDAILIPRLAQRLRAVRLPAGILPLNHSLVVASGLAPDEIVRMLEDPRVQAQADALALRVENGFRSYTATLARQLVIPYDIIPQSYARAA